MLRLTDKFLTVPDVFELTPKQKKVAEFLCENGSVTPKEAAYMCGVTSAVIKRLIVNGAAEEYEVEVMRNVEDGALKSCDPDDIVLSQEQQNAHDKN